SGPWWRRARSRLIWSARTASRADLLLRLIGMFCAAGVADSLPECDPTGNFPFGLIIRIPNGRLCLCSRRRVLRRMSAASLLFSWVLGGKVLKERGQRWAA